MPERLVIGTRGSELALWQANWVKSALERVYPEMAVELRIIKTTGDKILDTALSRIGGKGLFTKEIEQQLLAGTIDLAVHSLKDLPTLLPDGLGIGAVSEREDPADVLITRDHLTIEQLPAGAKVFTGSLRRRAQLLHRRGDLDIQDIRGNVNTRLRKFEESDGAGIVMALAGLRRLGMDDTIARSRRLKPEEFLPACGQGALAVEIRENDSRTREMISGLDDLGTRVTTTAERAVLACLEGGCQVPIGAYAWINGNQLHLRAMLSDLTGRTLMTARVSGDMNGPEALGKKAAQELTDKGGRKILDEINESARDKD
ncbi:MAG: hydroxymethylbilane synthase [Sedimentisphaerales bacterium]|nr:hydroxymethylbilane synthase [Sedimentisphaerales bacterium]